MAYDPVRRLIFYADYGTVVRSYDPITFVDKLVANVTWFIDGGLSVDPWTGLIFIGTSTVSSGQGVVQVINPANGAVATIATGFDSIHGVLRSALNGDLYVLADYDLWRVKGHEVGPLRYCTAKINSLGCLPDMQMSANPSVSASSGCSVTTINLIGMKNGLFFHSIQGVNAAPFHGGYLCVRLPIKRHAVMNSGGTGGTCTGSFFEDLNTYIWNGNDPQLQAGVPIAMQTWSRDPNDPFTDSLSNGVFAIIAP
jgi:hypothetical protein